MPLQSHLEAVYYIRGSLHIHIARELQNNTSPDSIDNGRTITSYVGASRYNTICQRVGQDILTQRSDFSYPIGFIDGHTGATISDFAYDTANILFPPS